MKKLLLITCALLSCYFIADKVISQPSADGSITDKAQVTLISYAGSTDDAPTAPPQSSQNYTFPDFYRGIYLTVSSGRDINKLKEFIAEAKRSHVNAFVIDCQSSRHRKCVIPPENVQLCIDNGIHPIARIVVFPDGLSAYPIPDDVMKEKLEIAESACISGFKEIQFDYIRFNDSNRLKKLTLTERYDFVEGFLSRAREHLKQYNIKTAADIFGRIPLNKSDLIGQRMEGLDKVVDIICPMAYPSHYTWSKKLQYDPYYTVFMTSQKAKERVQNAEIVTWIQAFKMKLGDIPYDRYVRDQIRAVHDSGIRGYLMWNARQDYVVPLAVMREYYSNNEKKVSQGD
jgi:hypothetical protein